MGTRRFAFSGLTLLVAFACGSPSENNGPGHSGTGGEGSGPSGGPGSGGSGTGATSSTGGAGSGGLAGTGGASASGGAPVSGDAPSVTVTYEADDSIFTNPERGFYTYSSLTDTDDYSYVREQGLSLAYTNVELAEFLGADHEKDLPAELLSQVQAGFDAVRDARIKAIVRFRYDSGEGYPDGTNDAPENWIIRHIEQLAPLLQENEDVIFQLQAGFIGAWGEWHTSTNFTDGTGDAEARERIVEALLTALPKTRRTALRYPAYKRMFFGNAPTTLEDMLSNADVARVGHLNDCFVSGAEDVGTYQYESMDVLKDYLEADSAFVPVGGETCAVHERNECSVALGEMERFHYTYLNQDYHPDVYSAWESDGCLDEMRRRLGYRLNLVSASIPQAVRPGGRFMLDVALNNSGFAALTNPRKVLLVLEGETERLQVELPTDPRSYLPGEASIRVRLQLPSELPEGPYRLALWLPDADLDLQQQVEYSVRLAGAGVWNQVAGDNTLATLQIDEGAAGEVDPAAETFSVIE